MKLPTIVLVHGFWGNALHWQHVIPLLIQQNFKVKAVEIPLTSLADDVERTNKMINQIDGPVLLVGHSYGVPSLLKQVIMKKWWGWYT